MTRGSALTIARLDNNFELSYIAVGNVLGLCWCMERSGFHSISFLEEGGILGYHLPALRLGKIQMQPGDVLMIATDGIKEPFSVMDPTFESPEILAERIFENHRNLRDDALLIVAQLRQD